MYEALRRLARRGELSREQLDVIVPTLTRFRAKRVPVRRLVAEAHALGTRFSAGDALYVALAKGIHGELFTRDRPLAEACRGVVAAKLF